MTDYLTSIDEWEPGCVRMPTDFTINDAEEMRGWCELALVGLEPDADLSAALNRVFAA